MAGVVWLCGAPQAQAQEAALLPEAAHARWVAIGRLNVTGFKSRGMCTATLIRPDRVLTAAHCVLLDDGRPIAPDRFRFVAGWFRGDYAAVARVVRVTGAAMFAAQGAHTGAAIADDIALLHLAEPVRAVRPLPVAAFAPDRPARLIGYRHDRPHALSDTGPCPAARRGRVLQLTCAATFGNSGGPVLQERDGVWRVVGVVSATGGGLTLAALVAGVR